MNLKKLSRFAIVLICVFGIMLASQAAADTAACKSSDTAPGGDAVEKKVDTAKSSKEKSNKKIPDGYEALKIKLPRPAFKGTPKHVPPGTNLEPDRKGPRPPFHAPKGTANVAKGKPVKASDSEPIIGEPSLITDGDKEANAGSYVEFGPGTQYVQIDLKKSYEILAIIVWHYHASARVYRDVVVQVAGDKDFILDVKTIFNNDHDNSSGLGVGKDKGYWETYEGRLIDAKGAKGRFVRLYSKGSTEDDMNHYTEVAVYAVEAK